MSIPIAADLASGGDQNEGPKEVTLNRACDYCRGLKVRCFPDPGSSSSTCQRCARSKRTCTFAAPQKRKQRKRTDARVAELEKEMKALRSLLQFGSSRGGQATEDLGTEQTERNLGPVQDASPDQTCSSLEINDHNLTTSSQVSMEMPSARVSDRGDLDVVDRGLLSMASAAELYNVYINELAPHYPAVTFPEHYTVDELRGQRPALFLAVVAAASGKTDPKLYTLLSTELLQMYASRTVRSGEKTLEFVQSLLLSAVWYYPGDTFDQLRFNQYIHMAATIALDIGLGSKPGVGTRSCQPPQNSAIVSPESQIQRSQDVSPLSTEEEPDIATIDVRRTILVCYLICSGVAVNMRRPNMLRFNSWMKECVNFLENLPMATVFDKRLIARVRLQNIAEEFASSLSLEDPDDSSIVLDSRTQLTVKAFERRLKTWKESVEPEIINASMLMIYYQINILLHEIALRDDHPAADFKPPYCTNRIRPGAKEKKKLTVPVIDAIMHCVTSSHDLLDTFLSLDVNILRALPVYKFAMVCYAILVLTKLSQSVEDPKSEIGKVLDHSGLALDSYSDAVVAKLKKAVGPEEFRVPGKFLGIILSIRAFLRREHYVPGQANGDNEVMRPLLHLSSQEPSGSDTRSLWLATSCSPGERSLASGSADHTSISDGPMLSSSHLSSHNHGTAANAHILSFTKNIDPTSSNSEYDVRFPPEQRTAYSGSQLIPELGINHELDMDHSVFSGVPESGLFTEGLHTWTPSTSIADQPMDEQMFDLPYWAYDDLPQP